MKNNSSWQLRAICAAGFAFVFILTQACTPEPLDSPCISGDCDARMIFPSPADENGYYHVQLDWTREYLPYFAVDVEASSISEEYRYNGVPVVEAEFDSDTEWRLGDNVVFTEPLYNPFTSNTTSAGNPLPVGTKTVNLSQFSGITLNIVQGTGLYFKEVDGKLYTRRIVGPIPPAVIGDTITLYMKIFWDAGSKSIFKNHYKESFIVE